MRVFYVQLLFLYGMKAKVTLEIIKIIIKLFCLLAIEGIEKLYQLIKLLL